jgi:K+-transporting ATPase c subunit
MIGSGMVVFAIGLVFVWLLVLLAGVAFPRLIRGIGKLCGRLFHRGGAQA